MKNTWKRTAAFVLAMALVVGAVPTNVGTGGLFDKAAITASAGDEETTLVVTWADGAEQHTLAYSDVPVPTDLIVKKGEEEIFDYEFGIPTYDGTKGTVEIKEVTDHNADGTPVYGATGTVSFTAETKEVTTFDFVDYRLEGAEDAEGMVLIYDGLKKEPKFTSLSVNGIPVTENEYTLSYAQNVNVSTNPKRPPVIYVTFNSNRFTGVSVLAFTITAVDINALNIKPVSFVADGNSHTPVFDSGIEGSALRFKILEGWYKATTDEENNVTGYEPAEEGEEGAFYSTKTATEKGNYQALIESTNKINCIGQRVIDWSIADIQYVSKTYDGEAVGNANFTIDNLVGEYGEDSVSIAYYDKNADVTTAPPIAAPIDAGDYRAVVTITDKNTEEGHVVLPTLTKTVDFTIAQKSIVVTPSPTSKSYLSDTPAIGCTATNPEGVSGDVIVQRDQTTLVSELQRLFKLENPVAKNALVGTTTAIVFDDATVSKFSNYDLGYTPTNFRVVEKSIEDATVTFEKEVTEEVTEPVYENSFSCTYDGKEHTPVIKVTDSSGNILKENVDYEIAEKTKDGNTTTTRSATNAATYSIVLKGIGNYDGEKVVTWTITQKNIADYISEKSTAGTSDAVTVTGATYDGNEHAPTIGVGVGSEALTENTDFTVTATAQTNAGADYDFTITGAGNYQGTYSGKWEIKKADAGIAATGTKVYDGVAARAEDITIDLEKLPTGFVSTTTTGDGDDAVTTQNISVKFYDYNGIPVFNEETKEYIGSSIEDGNGVLKQYLGDEALKMSKGNEVENAINAGNYIAEVTISDASGNYNNAVQLMYFPIAKRQAEIYPESGQSKEYHAAVPEIKFELEEAVEGSNRGVLAADMEKTIGIDGEEVNWVSLLSFTDEMEADTPMGTYEIDIDAFAAPDLMNYEISCSYPVEFEVTPRSLEDNVVFVLKATKGEFNQNSEQSNAFLYDGSNKQVAIDYAYDKNWTVDVNAPDGVMVGGNWYKKLTASDYSTAGVVKMAYSGDYAAQAEGMGNYAGKVISGNGLDWHIEDATAEIRLNADAANKTYDGEAVNGSAFVVEAVTANYPLNKATVTYSYKKVTGYDTASNPITQVVEGAPTDAGTYLVTATAVRRGYANATATAQFTIAPKEVTISVTGAVDSITYGDTLPTLGKEVVGVLEGEDLGLTGDYQIVKDDVAVTEAVPNAGVYTIRGNFTATNTNYTLTPETKAFTILKKDLEDVDGTIEIVSELTNAISDYGVTQAPEFTVVYKAQTGNKTLVSDVANSETYDYAVNAPTILADGNYTIEVVGEGNYTGIREINWTVTETDEAKEAARAAIAEAAKVEFTDFSIVSESNKRIGVTVHGAVESPEGKNYTVLKTGFVAYRGKELPEGTKLTIEEADGTTIYNLSKGINYSSSTMKDTEDSIYIRGYVIVGDGTYKAVKYTEIENVSISGLKEKASALQAALDATKVEITNTTITNSAKKKIGMTVEATVAEGLTAVKTGLIAYRNANEVCDVELTVAKADEDANDQIYNLSKGVLVSSSNLTFTDELTHIHYVPYSIVTDADGNEYTVYGTQGVTTFDALIGE